jgi:uncharacterized integral membrane protein
MSTRGKIRLYVGLFLLLLLVLVVAQNSGPVVLHFLVWKADVDGPLLFFLLFMAGMAAGTLITLVLHARRGKD